MCEGECNERLFETEIRRGQVELGGRAYYGMEDESIALAWEQIVGDRAPAALAVRKVAAFEAVVEREQYERHHISDDAAFDFFGDAA